MTGTGSHGYGGQVPDLPSASRCAREAGGGTQRV